MLRLCAKRIAGLELNFLPTSIGGASPMTPENPASINAEDIIEVALHHEIKFRAYELYERQHDTIDGHALKDKLQAELPRVVYAAAQLQKYADGEVGDTRAVRAARVYLRALTSFIAFD
jgi:hypothetical protein